MSTEPEEKCCHCHNDPCDPEGCNVSIKEFVDGKCGKLLYRDMIGDPEWRKWIEYVSEKKIEIIRSRIK